MNDTNRRFHSFHLAGSVLKVPVRLDEPTGRYFMDCPDLEENLIYTKCGHLWSAWCRTPVHTTRVNHLTAQRTMTADPAVLLRANGWETSTVPAQMSVEKAREKGITERKIFNYQLAGQGEQTFTVKNVTYTINDDKSITAIYHFGELSMQARITYRMVKLDKGSYTGTTDGYIRKDPHDSGNVRLNRYVQRFRGTFVGYEDTHTPTPITTGLPVTATTVFRFYYGEGGTPDNAITATGFTEAYTDSFAVANQFVALDGVCGFSGQGHDTQLGGIEG